VDLPGSCARHRCPPAAMTRYGRLRSSSGRRHRRNSRPGKSTESCNVPRERAFDHAERRIPHRHRQSAQQDAARRRRRKPRRSRSRGWLPLVPRPNAVAWSFQLELTLTTFLLRSWLVGRQISSQPPRASASASASPPCGSRGRRGVADERHPPKHEACAAKKGRRALGVFPEINQLVDLY